MARSGGLTIALIASLWSLACGQSGPTPRVRHVDLLASLATAEKRPQGGVFTATIVTLDGKTQPVLEVPASSRVVWSERMPDDAVLRTAVGSSESLREAGGGVAVFRIGVSDERSYDALATTEVGLGPADRWQPVSIDLSKYGGFKLSLFYHPRSKTWNIIFSTIVQGLPRAASPADTLYWARPVIEEAR